MFPDSWRGPAIGQSRARRLVMSARKRPTTAALAAPPKKRLRGKQEAPGYNDSLPDKFLAWRALRVYTAYKKLGGGKLVQELDSLALAEPNSAHYAEYMGIYIDGRLAVEGQPSPPLACWLKAAAAQKPSVRKVPAGRRGETNFCRGFDGNRCRFNTKEAGLRSHGSREEQRCLLCSETVLKQSCASPGGRRNLTCVLKALRNHEDPDIFEAACARLALWLSAEEANGLRVKAAAAKRARPTHKHGQRPERSG